MSKRDVLIKKTSSGKLKRGSSHSHVKNKPSRVSAQYVEKPDEYIISFLKRNWEHFCCENLPTIYATVIVPNSRIVPLTGMTIGYDESRQKLLAVFCKDFDLLEAGMESLKSTFEYFQTLTTLKFQFCNLSYEMITVLSQILSDNACITHVNVDGNSAVNESCDLLFRNNNVSYMSMRLCNIDDFGMPKICDELGNASLCMLQHLNLASNLLFDECVPYVANILKVNRSLVSLNIADNKITDLGCKELFMALQRFKLTHDDIVIRRHRRLEHFVKQMTMMEQYGISNQAKTCAKFSDSESRKNARKSQASKGNMKHVSRSYENILRIHQIEETSQIMKIINDELGVDMHPFVKDSWEENTEIYCQGNFNLLHMNVSYNRITNAGLVSIVDVLKYQKQYRNEELCGLVKLSLEGNLFQPECNEMLDIELLLSRTEINSRGSISLSRENGSVHSANKRRPSSRKSIP